MVHCKHCKSTFDQKFVLLHDFTSPRCPLCHMDVGMDALDKTAESSKLLPDGSNYDKYAYLNPGFTTDVAIFRWKRDTRKIQVLLIKRMYNPYQGKWALPGGFYDERKDSCIHDIAARELKEETGLDGLWLFQGVPFGSKDRDPRQFTVTAPYCSIVPADAELPAKAGDDAEKWGWFDVDTMAKPVDWVAFDHVSIIYSLLWDTIGTRVQAGQSGPLQWFLSESTSDEALSTATMPEIRALLHQLRIQKPFRTTQHLESWLKARSYRLEQIVDEKEKGARGRPAQVYKLT